MNTSVPTQDIFRCDQQYSDHGSTLRDIECSILHPMKSSPDFKNIILGTWLMVNESSPLAGSSYRAINYSKNLQHALNYGSDRSLWTGISAGEASAESSSCDSENLRRALGNKITSDAITVLRVPNSTATVPMAFCGFVHELHANRILVIGGLLLNSKTKNAHDIWNSIELIGKCLQSLLTSTYINEAYRHFALIDFPRKYIWHNTKIFTRGTMIDVVSDGRRRKRRHTTPPGWRPSHIELVIKKLYQVRIGQRHVIRYADQPDHWLNGTVVFVDGAPWVTKNSTSKLVAFDKVRIPVRYEDVQRVFPRTIKIVNLRIIGPT